MQQLRDLANSLGLDPDALSDADLGDAITGALNTERERMEAAGGKPLDRARFNLTNSRASVNTLIDWLNHFAESDDLAESDQAIALAIGNVVATFYGPLSAIAWALIAQAEPTPAPAPSVDVDALVTKVWTATAESGAHTASADAAANAVREALTR